MPRHREVILLSDLVDVAKPGEDIEVTGIYKNNYDGNLNAKNGFPVFATILEANSIRRKESSAFMGGNNLVNMWTEEEIREFRKLSHEKVLLIKSLPQWLHPYMVIKILKLPLLVHYLVVCLKMLMGNFPLEVILMYYY